MGKRNKIRYTATPKKRVEINPTGNVYLQYVDEETVEQTLKGDFLVYAECEALHTTRLGQYGQTGFVGYLKVDVYDAKEWQPFIITDFFKARENHFSRTERPIDTYHLCKELLAELKGRTLVRTYREHYELEE